jgi:hypothetical protein
VALNNSPTGVFMPVGQLLSIEISAKDVIKYILAPAGRIFYLGKSF